MQISVRPCRLVGAAWNLVNSPQLTGCRRECSEISLVAMKQLSQADTGHLWKTDGIAWVNHHGRPIRIQQPGAMRFPGHPVAGSNKHANATVCQRQKSVPEPDHHAAAKSPSFQKHAKTIADRPLSLIHSNPIHEPCNDSLKEFNHGMEFTNSTTSGEQGYGPETA